jgi:hypothetical protein
VFALGLSALILAGLAAPWRGLVRASNGVKPATDRLWWVTDPNLLSLSPLTNKIPFAAFTSNLTISGHVTNVNGRGLSGIKMKIDDGSTDLCAASPGICVTDSSGAYSFAVPAGGSYTVGPKDSRVSTWFKPHTNPPLSIQQDTILHDPLTQDVNNDDFTAGFPSFTVAGAVKTQGGTVFPNQIVKLAGGASKNYTTNTQGQYTSDQLNVLGDYTFTPQPFTANGITYNTFNPANLNFVSMIPCDPNTAPPGVGCSGFNYTTADFVAVPAPTVTTSAASSITTTAATLNGSANPNGIAANAWFEWGTDPTLTTSNATSSQAVGAGTTNQTITANLTNLTAGTAYYFRAVAMSSGGTVRGSILNFSSAPAPRTFQFSSSGYSVNEGDGFVTVTVTRSGDTSVAASVDYTSSDGAGSQSCSVINGKASSKCDYLSAIGTLKFAVGETAKTVVVQIIDDAYAEGAETFNLSISNPSSPAVLGSVTTAIVAINDNDVTNGVDPIDDASFFVRQHYIDFLNRQADPSGLNFWTGTITSCGSDQQCNAVKRVNASAAFFVSIEFQNTGYLVYRIYKSAYGNPGGAPVPIRLKEFLPDTQEIGQGVIVNQGNWQQQLENNKQAFTLEFVQRSSFTAALPSTLTPAQFVDAMFANAGVTPSTVDRNTAINEFSGAGNTTDVTARSRALRDVAENTTLNTQEFNRAFVLMQYFGYLRRNPNDAPDSDFSGYNFWLTKLIQFGGNYIDAEMVKAFITSAEYRQRFGP